VTRACGCGKQRRRRRRWQLEGGRADAEADALESSTPARPTRAVSRRRIARRGGGRCGGTSVGEDGAQYLVEGMIPLYGMLGMLIAFAKVGKTSLGYALGVAGRGATPWYFPSGNRPHGICLRAPRSRDCARSLMPRARLRPATRVKDSPDRLIDAITELRRPPAVSGGLSEGLGAAACAIPTRHFQYAVRNQLLKNRLVHVCQPLEVQARLAHLVLSQLGQ
jgi:hypothetical protein